MSEVTRLLEAVEEGNAEAAETLLPIVYQELRQLASFKMSKLPPGQTLQATALVHEAFLRLVNVDQQQRWENRGHFFSAAAEAMRRILVERARYKSAQKRGGKLSRVDLEHVTIAPDTDNELLVLLDEALSQLAEEDPTGAELIKLRFFAGLPNRRAAELLGLSERSARRSWAFARAWLYDKIQNQL